MSTHTQCDSDCLTVVTMGSMCSQSRASGYKTGGGGGDGGEGAGAEEKKDDHIALAGMHSDGVSCVCDCGPDFPDYVMSGGLDKHIIVNNWKTGEMVHKWKAHDKAVNTLAYGSKTNMVFSGSRDLSIRQWKLGESVGTPLAVMEGHTTNIAAMSLSTDNTRLCSGARDTSVRIWDVATSTQLFMRSLPRNLVTCMRYLPNEPCFAQGAEDLAVRIWDPRSGALRPVQTLSGYVYFPLDIDVTDDGNYILTSSKGFNNVGAEAKLWDRRTGKLVREYTGHKQDAVACRFLRRADSSTHPDRFATASKDMTLRVWEQDTGVCALQHMEFNSGMFTSLAVPEAPASRGHLFAGSFNGGVFVYDTSAASSLQLVARTTPQDMMD